MTDDAGREGTVRGRQSLRQVPPAVLSRLSGPVVGGGYVSCPSTVRWRIRTGDRDVCSIMQDLGDWTELSFPASVTAVTFPTSLAELEAMALPTVVLDLDGKILALNSPAMRLGSRQRHEIVGKLASEYAPGLEYLWADRVAAGRAPDGATFEIAITTRRGAFMLEYVVKVYELDGQTAVVAVVTRARPLT